MKLSKSVVEGVAQIASTDIARHNLMHVHVKRQDTEAVNVEATNGRTALRFTIEDTQETHEAEIPLGAMLEAKRLKKLASAIGSGGESHINISANDDGVVVAESHDSESLGGLVLQSSATSKPFPNLDMVIPKYSKCGDYVGIKKGEKYVGFCFDPVLMIKLLQAIIKGCELDGAKWYDVTMYVPKKKDEAAVIHQVRKRTDINVMSATGVIMPIRTAG